MKIKTKIYFFSGLILVLVAIMAGMVFNTRLQINDSRGKLSHILTANQGIVQLNILSDDFLINREQRANIQWQEKYDSLDHFFNENPDEAHQHEHDAIELELIGKMTVEYQQIGDLFSKIKQTEPNSDLYKQLTNQISITSLGLTNDSYSLVDYGRSKIIVGEDKLYFVLIVTFIILPLALGLFLLTLLPLLKFIGIVAQISKGNFDTKLETDRKDELGDLSRAFERMAISLKLAMRGQRPENQKQNLDEDQPIL